MNRHFIDVLLKILKDLKIHLAPPWDSFGSPMSSSPKFLDPHVHVYKIQNNDYPNIMTSSDPPTLEVRANKLDSFNPFLDGRLKTLVSSRSARLDCPNRIMLVWIEATTQKSVLLRSITFD